MELKRLIHSKSVLMEIDQPSRKRRGWFNGIGQIHRTLFDIMDDADRELMAKHLNHPDQRQARWHDVTRMQEKIINSTISQIIEAERAVEESEKLMFNTML